MIASANSIVVTARQHIDAGHAWLEVAYAHLEQLGIAASISPYSHRDGDTVYLEEDCDEPLFLDAAMAAGWDIRFETVAYSDLAPLRELPRYRPGPSAAS